MGNTRVDGTETRLACGSLAKTSELIRSDRDEEQVKSQEPPGSTSGCAFVMRANGRSLPHRYFAFEYQMLSPQVVP